MTAHGEESRELKTVRSDWLRLYHPHDSISSTNQHKMLKIAVFEMKEASRSAAASHFLSQNAILLENKGSADMKEALNELMLRAQDISMNLGTQRIGLRCIDSYQLPATFDHESTTMEAHSLHNKDLAENDAALDGRPIVLVTQPAVIAIGKSDGSDYGVRRVLEKAVVLVG